MDNLIQINVPGLDYDQSFQLHWLVRESEYLLDEQEIAIIEFLNGANVTVYSMGEGIIQKVLIDGEYHQHEHSVLGYIDISASGLPIGIYEVLKKNREVKKSHLDLSGMQLDEVPKQILSFKWLTSVNLENNKLTSVNIEWARLGNLKKLELKGNDLRFPNDVYDYPYEKLIYYIENSVVLNRIRACKELKCSFLRLRGLGLKKIVPELYDLVHLVSLDLSDNAIEEVDDRILKLNELIDINLENNNLSYFPKQFIKMNSLQKLNLNSNNIEDFRYKYFFTQYGLELFLEDIKSIVRANTLRKIESRISKLSSLNFSNTGFRTRKSVSNYLNRHSLGFLMDNELLFDTLLKYISIESDIQDVITCKIDCNLKLVSLNNNGIKNFPFSIFKIPTLEIIELERNFIDNIPYAILNQGVGSVRNYIEQIEKESKEYEYLYESKLVLVGKGNVGKTSLSRKIINPKVRLRKNEAATEGVDVNSWIVDDYRSDKSFKFDIWDFAGQDKYDATHQLFVTGRSFYLLVVEARDEMERLVVEKWLSTIKSLANSSPVVIVMNKIDIKDDNFEIRHYKRYFPNIVDFVKISCSDKSHFRSSIYNLIEVIKRNINKLPQVREKLPKSWIRIREVLQTYTEKYISYEEYIKVCKNLGLDEEKAVYLSRFFHDLGIFIHFIDHPKLKDFVILDYDWCAEGLYKILDSEIVANNNGVFTKSELAAVFNGEYSQYKREFVDIMIRFDLCFKIENMNRYVIPRLLNKDMPDFEWSNNNNLVYLIDYDFLPKALVPRFIVRNNSLIVNEYCWRFGAYLKFDKTVAYISEIPHKNQLIARVRGDDRKELLSIIRKSILDIHSEIYRNIGYQEKIQCNCSVCLDSVNPELFRYFILRERLKIGKKTIYCDRGHDEVDIQKLIYDTFSSSNDGNALKVRDLVLPAELKALISDGRVEYCINNLLDISKESDDKSLINELIIVQSTYRELKSKDRMGVIQLVDFEHGRNRIKQAILEIIDILYS